MSKTLTNQQKKDWAKMLYMQGELQSRQIAEKVGVSPVTMSKWSKEGNWEMLRAAVTTTREEQIRNLYMQIAEMNKAIAERGDKYATSFSNEYGSYKSSLGFYLTETTYQGRNGYSLILNGLEKGINDRARERAIVVHGAAYADPSVASRGGRLGRSFGCPAVPQKLSRPIIDAIKGGSVMYIYAEAPDYLAHSSVLKKTTGL